MKFASVLVCLVGLSSQKRRAADDDTALARAKKAAEVQATFYNTGSGLFDTTGWWNAANVLTAMADYMLLSGDEQYLSMFGNTVHLQGFEKNRFFRNEYYDDTVWWGLAFGKAYDLTGDESYLDLAVGCAEWVNDSWDEICGGGVYWRRFEQGKNAIGNGLFLKLAGVVGNRLPEGEEKFSWLRRAQRGYDWYKAAGYYNEEGTINDGLIIHKDKPCENNGLQVWSYNQGVIIGALVELAQAFPTNATFLADAKALADASLRSELNVKADGDEIGVLVDPGCGHGGSCGNDVPSFKGVFMRNLGELNRALAAAEPRPFTEWIRHQADVVTEKTTHADGKFGTSWLGPINEEGVNAASHHSGFEVMTASLNANYAIKNKSKPATAPWTRTRDNTIWNM